MYYSVTIRSGTDMGQQAIAENMVIKANREKGMLTCALRLSGLFGYLCPPTCAR